MGRQEEGRQERPALGLESLSKEFGLCFSGSGESEKKYDWLYNVLCCMYFFHA